MSISTFNCKGLYEEALQWWLGMPRAAGESDHYLGKSHTCRSPGEKATLIFLVKDMRSETELFQQLKFKDFRGGVRYKVMALVSGYSGLPQTRDFLFFCLFPPNTRTQRQPRDHGLLPKQRKETSSFLVHPLWKHKSAIRSYRFFILFIINIVPEAVTYRRKRYERISTYFDN